MLSEMPLDETNDFLESSMVNSIETLLTIILPVGEETFDEGHLGPIRDVERQLARQRPATKFSFYCCAVRLRTRTFECEHERLPGTWVKERSCSRSHWLLGLRV